MTSKPNSRELAKQETREALIRAGTAAFVEEGVDLPSLDAICARAGFTRGAFYVHFKDREDFFAAVADQAVRDFVDWIFSTHAPQIELDGLDGIVERFLTAVTEGQKLPAPHKLLMQIAARGSQRGPASDAPYGVFINGALSRMQDVVRTGQTQGSVKRDLDPSQLGLLLVASAVGFVVLCGGGFDPNVEEVRALCRRLIFNAGTSDSKPNPSTT
ncbi:MAG TPA: TetR/AcrR family transcriptional regulator [Polyangiales bacterium]|jgi:AcrR family transcriptional regulator|nr:TetR/AcrR family transcriptional regulator [Polyangiales bacterium]